MSNSGNDIKNTDFDFGSLLSGSRLSQKYTLEDVSRHLKIPVPVIEALEANDIASLPPPTFTKGYIRAYARFLEISEDKVLDIYSRAVPHNRVAKLKSRSNLPSEKNSQTPLIKTVTVFLIIAGITALIYGGFEYYQDKASVLEDELEAKQPDFTGNSLDSPGPEAISIEQNAKLTDDDELILQPPVATESPETAEGLQVDAMPSGMGVEDASHSAIIDSAPETSPVTDTLPESGPGENESSAQQVTGDGAHQDTIEIFAEKGSWMEIRDADNIRLYYNLLPEGSTKTLHGPAPFYVSIGNARTTKVIINGLEVDHSDYIRANNTARFKVSSEQQFVVFH